MIATPAWTEHDLAAFVGLHGLSALPPDQTTRMLGLSRRVAEAGAAISRQSSKSSEPGGVFRVRDLA